ncbi:hypothetical protein BU16DRAFT_241562 [Lophium mytilinum]|uniref:Uncharacterized protein n=1 Tax=Lophium mytilinum TaxID=390894 RepID=A0A6A6R9W2_9PEZI|nr:hypothetical protein BU16DRAFT_241562 [Lophium mytilinum]
MRSFGPGTCAAGNGTKSPPLSSRLPLRQPDVPEKFFNNHPETAFIFFEPIHLFNHPYQSSPSDGLVTLCSAVLVLGPITIGRCFSLRQTQIHLFAVSIVRRRLHVANYSLAPNVRTLGCQTMCKVFLERSVDGVVGVPDRTTDCRLWLHRDQ